MATVDGTQRPQLGSLDTRADLYGSPNVPLPPKYLMASTSHHISKLSDMVQHDQTSSDESSPINTPMPNPPMVTSDDFALAFDIDGVLIRGGQPIPEAVDAMKYINGDNPYGVKVYVIPMFSIVSK
jgi:hypothetical protein